MKQIEWIILLHHNISSFKLKQQCVNSALLRNSQLADDGEFKPILIHKINTMKFIIFIGPTHIFCLMPYALQT